MSLATCSTYDELIDALRTRKDALGLSNNDLDALAGTPAGYAGKIFGAARVRALGPLSFDCFLGALGLRFTLIEDEEQTARIRERSGNPKRILQGVKYNHKRNRSLKDSLRRLAVRNGRKGGRMQSEGRMKKLTPKQRQEIARNAIKTRWAKRKALGAAIERDLGKRVARSSNAAKNAAKGADGQ